MTDESGSETQESSESRRFDVFISHASADKDIARLLAKRLTGEGVRVWLDDTQLKLGEPWQEQIRDAIEQCRVCVILLSDHALPSKPWVSQEWSAIQNCSWRREDLAICPVKLDDAVTPPFLRQWQSLSLDRHSKDPGKLDQAVKQIILVLWRGAHRQRRAEIEQSETAERFTELQEALIRGQAKPAADNGPDSQ